MRVVLREEDCTGEKVSRPAVLSAFLGWELRARARMRQVRHLWCKMQGGPRDRVLTLRLSHSENEASLHVVPKHPLTASLS